MVFLKSDSKYLIVIGIDHFSNGGVRESFVDSFVSCVLWEWERLFFNKCLFGFLIDGPVAVYLAVQRRLVQKQMLRVRDALHSDCIHPFWWDFLRRCIIILRLNVQTMRLRSMFFFILHLLFPGILSAKLRQHAISSLKLEPVSKQLLRRSNSKLFWGNWVHVTKIYWLTGIIHPPPPISPHHPSLWNKLGSTLHRGLLGSCPSMFCRWSYNWAIYRQIILRSHFYLCYFYHW